MTVPHTDRRTVVFVLIAAGVLFGAIGAVAFVRKPSSQGNDVISTTFTAVASDGVRVAGELHRPTGDSRSSVVLLVHDAGADRDQWDETVPFFLRKGYAVLTFDRRGHGQSTTRIVGAVEQDVLPTAATIKHGIDDLTALFAWLAGQKTVNTESVFLVGVGTGATLAYAVSGTYSQLVTTIAISPKLAGEALPGSIREFVRPTDIFFLVGNEDDGVARQLFDRTENPRFLEVYPENTPGIGLLASPQAQTDILTWIATAQ